MRMTSLPRGCRSSDATRVPLRAAVAMAGIAVIVSCSPPSGGGSVTRDSVGIRIVESRSPAWTDRAGWAIPDSATLQIGAMEGPAEYQFESIGAVRELTDGRVVVADDRAGKLRAYDATGRFLWASGRSGEGPGEYRRIVAVGEGPGDSLWAWDFGLRRFTILTDRGRVVRLVRVDAPLSSLLAVGRLGDGTFLMRESFSTEVHREGTALGLTRALAALVRISADGSLLDTVRLVMGREYYLGEEGGRGVMSAPLFARETSVVLAGTELYAGEQTAFEIGCYTLDGQLRTLIRVPGVDLRITETDVQSLVDRELDGLSSAERAMRERHLASMAVPDTKPAYGQLLLDPDGNLWAAEYARHPSPPTRWTVFDRGGRLLGIVTMPDRFDLRQVGRDRVLGVWRDPLEVEYVRRYPLVKP